MARLGEIVEVTYFRDSGAVGSLVCNLDTSIKS